MLPLPISPLEQCIDRLILLYKTLQLENRQLCIQIAQLETEKSHLLSQHQQATTHIQKVMHQLQEEIHERST